MSLVKSKDSKPEMQLRRLVFSMGYRYRLHVKDLPGKPDLVFPAKKAVIFMNSCFWHLHENCKLARVPSSNRAYWLPKLASNKKRDLFQHSQLRSMGWRVLVVWECELKNKALVSRRIYEFLSVIPLNN